jgi:hypothetical protein
MYKPNDIVLVKTKDVMFGDEGGVVVAPAIVKYYDEIIHAYECNVLVGNTIRWWGLYETEIACKVGEAVPALFPAQEVEDD